MPSSVEELEQAWGEDYVLVAPACTARLLGFTEAWLRERGLDGVLVPKHWCLSVSEQYVAVGNACGWGLSIAVLAGVHAAPAREVLGWIQQVRGVHAAEAAAALSAAAVASASSSAANGGRLPDVASRATKRARVMPGTS